MRLSYYFDTWANIWHGIVPVFLKICTDLQEICSIWTQNCFFLLFLNYFSTETITKTILSSYAAHFLKICENLQKSWNNMMSNDCLIIEIHGSVSYSFSCILQVLWWNENNHEWNRWRKFLGNRGFPIQIGHLWKEYQNIYEKSNRLRIKYRWSTEGH